MTIAPSLPMGPAALSDNTQAVLLLTSPLLAGGSEGSVGAKLLSAGEYSQLAISLRQAQHQPADLLNGGRNALLAAAPAVGAAIVVGTSTTVGGSEMETCSAHSLNEMTNPPLDMPSEPRVMETVMEY